MDSSRKFFRMAMPILLLAAAFVAQARAQSPPAAIGPAGQVWAGGEYANAAASFPYQSGQRLTGASGFADILVTNRIGFEGEANFLPVGGFEGSTESSYLAGPWAILVFRGRFVPYAKFLVGEGRIHYPFSIGDASYLALAPGAGVDYRLKRHWLLRVEYEYQMWPNSPGYANEPDHELTPNGFHIGLAYRVWPR